MTLIKKILPILLIMTAFAFAGCSSSNEKDESMSENNKVRLSMITVNPEYLDEYNTFLKEEIEASMRLEPGVLMLYAVSENENPNKITILEIYADEGAYQQHIKTAHFLKYKEGTLHMVDSLELIDTTPLIPGLKIK